MNKILFIDRDGVLIEEPADEQIDSFEKLRLVQGVIPALIRIRNAGYEFVMVTNQDGLGTASFPREHFEGPQQLLLQILNSQGIRFREVLIDESFAHEGKSTRKPGIGLVMHYLRDRSIDLSRSGMVGDRETDMQFAQNLGVKAFRLKPEFYNWAQIADELCDSPRVASIERNTKETRIRVMLNLDKSADPVIATGHSFFDHMLEQLGKHSGFALSVQCAGDLHIDEHHTVEDSAIAIGQALKEAIGDKRGITRYAFTLPMDETLASAALDVSGRSYFVFEGQFPRAEVGGLATELVPHFFRSLCDAAGLNLHLTVRGENTHHMVEACFKSVARVLGQALKREGNSMPSTKGVL
jgi:imidazoleglycerol-phosphate dehydratase / histidinol-phosphatase